MFIRLRVSLKWTVSLSVTETSSSKNFYAEQIMCMTSTCVMSCGGYVAPLKMLLMLLFGISPLNAKDCWHEGVDAYIQCTGTKTGNIQRKVSIPAVNQIVKKNKCISLSENLYRNINCIPGFPFRLKKLKFLFRIFIQTLKIMLLVHNDFMLLYQK